MARSNRRLGSWPQDRGLRHHLLCREPKARSCRSFSPLAPSSAKSRYIPVRRGFDTRQLCRWALYLHAKRTRLHQARRVTDAWPLQNRRGMCRFRILLVSCESWSDKHVGILVMSALQVQWSSLNRARARGFTGVLRRGGTLLFRLLPKQSLRKERGKLSFGSLPKKRPLALEA